MLAVIEIWGNQFTVKKGDIIDVKRQGIEKDEIITSQALLISDAEWEDVKIWTPLLAWSKIQLKVLEHFKDEKVRVFKMKSKKRYMRNRWFRASMTKLEVLSIA
jgi:large subunit ribosomal protein L21